MHASIYSSRAIEKKSVASSLVEKKNCPNCKSKCHFVHCKIPRSHYMDKDWKTQNPSPHKVTNMTNRTISKVIKTVNQGQPHVNGNYLAIDSIDLSVLIFQL